LGGLVAAAGPALPVAARAAGAGMVLVHFGELGLLVGAAPGPMDNLRVF